MSTKRQIQTGGTYQLPPSGRGIAPDFTASPQEWQQTIIAAAEQVCPVRSLFGERVRGHVHDVVHGMHGWLHVAALSGSTRCVLAQVAALRQPGREARLSDGAVRAFQGVSPSLMHELCYTARLSPGASVHTISTEGWARLREAWQAWLECLHSGSFGASRDADTGRLSVIGSYSGTVEGGVQMGIATLFQQSQVCGNHLSGHPLRLSIPFIHPQDLKYAKDDYSLHGVSWLAK